MFDGTIDMLSQWDYIYFFNTFFNCRVIVKFVAQQMTIVSAWKYKARGLKYLQGHWSFKIALVSLFLKKMATVFSVVCTSLAGLITSYRMSG